MVFLWFCSEKVRSGSHGTGKDSITGGLVGLGFYGLGGPDEGVDMETVKIQGSINGV